MARGRMLDLSMWQNEKFLELPVFARLLQVNLINAADDQGRIRATPKYLKMQVFPFDDVSLDAIQGWLDQIRDNGTIILYTVDGKQYAQLVNWWKYQSLQYAQPSQFPRPEGWQDRIRRTVTKGYIATCNWMKVNGEPIADTCDQDGRPLPGKEPHPHTPDSDSDTPVAPPIIQRKQASHSPESSGVHSGESSGEGTSIRLTKDKETTTTLQRAEESKPEEKSGSGGSGSLPSQRSRQSDVDYARICSKFENEGFGTLTEIFAQQISAMLDEYPVDWIDDAMIVAVSAGTRTLRYTTGILKRWRSEGRNDKKAAATSQAPKVLTLKEWCLKEHTTDVFTVIPGGEAGVRERYNQYKQQQQQTH